MKRRVLALLLVLVLSLSGCFFTVNHPVIGPDGTMAVFLDEAGAYALSVESGTLHLLRDGAWVPIPAATVSETGGVLDVSPDGSEFLYVDIQSVDLFGPITSTLYRVQANPEAIPEALLETDSSIAKAVWTDEGIYLLCVGEEDLGVLEVLDPETRELEWLHGYVLSFRFSPENKTIDLMGVDQDGDLIAGFVERWDRLTNRRPEQAIFILSDATIEAFLTLPHDFLWDVSPDGRWLALALYDPTMMEPVSEKEEPDLYLIDTESDTSERISVQGMMPAFSPDGTTLVFLTIKDGVNAIAMQRDLSSGETSEIVGTEGVSTLFWIAENRLGLTFESDDYTRLAEINLVNGEVSELIENSM